MKKPLLFTAISLTAILLLGGCGGGGSTAAQVGASSDLVGSSDLGGGLSSEAGENDPEEASDLGGSLEADGTSANKLPQRSSEPATVYFTSDISAEGLVRIYEALGWSCQNIDRRTAREQLSAS